MTIINSLNKNAAFLKYFAQQFKSYIKQLLQSIFGKNNIACYAEANMTHQFFTQTNSPGMAIAVGFKLVRRGLISFSVSICDALFEARFCSSECTCKPFILLLLHPFLGWGAQRRTTELEQPSNSSTSKSPIVEIIHVCLFVCDYPSSSSGWRYGMNGNSGSCRQPN